MGKADEFWNDFYTQQPDKEAPSDFLKSMAHRLSKGRCLDIGCGSGHDATFLAGKGFQVTGFDISKVAIGRAQERAQSLSVEVDFKSMDLDLFVFGLMEYDSIVAVDFRPPLPRYYSEFIRSLKQGGTILVDSLLVDEMEEALGQEDGYRNYFYSHNELLKNLKGLRILYYHEGDVHGRQRVQLLAQKPMDRDAAKYDFFNIQSTKQEKPAHNKQRELAEQLFKKKT